MTNKDQTIKLQQFITFYSNHNDIQLKNLGEVVFAIKTYLKLSVKDNEIEISCNENDISQFLNSLENIFSNYTMENLIYID